MRTGREVERPLSPEELLVHAHRDKHPVEIVTQFAASRVLDLTGREDLVRRGLRAANSLGTLAGEAAGRLLGSRRLERTARRLLGVTDRVSALRFRETTHLSGPQAAARIETLRQQADEALRALGRGPRLVLLVTGATGFVGKEIVSQASGDRRIAEVVALVRPQKVFDKETGKLLRVVSPEERGAELLRLLHVPARKFRFIAGDIERPFLGIEKGELQRLRRSVTHVIHCAASVAFDDTYENSFRANVLGCRNALELSLHLQQARGSRFVHHVAIETSYIHGRTRSSLAQEHALDFPRHFYNNYYELTKAMASIETDRFMIEHGLRVVQVLPSIVIGDARTGNNRGDTKVVNAPANAFGRAGEAGRQARGVPARVKALLVGAAATAFPGDPTAQLNLVPVDRVVAGVMAALWVPRAIGSRIHLATDNRIRTDDMLRICREELGVRVRLADPTIYRNLTLPLVRATLVRMGEPRLARALEKLGMVFGGYSEWGQPVHRVGNDVRLLGLPIRRPDTGQAFRMLCRHNRYVQEYARVREAREIARRERIWEQALTDIELSTGREAGALQPREFRSQIEERIDLATFRARSRSAGPSGRRRRQARRGA